MPSTAKVKLAFTCKISPRKFWWLLYPPRGVMGLLGHPTANKSPHHQHLNKATNTSNWAKIWFWIFRVREIGKAYQAPINS